MKTSFQKESFGGGFGINRNTGGARSLPTAEPPLAHVTVKPGSGYSRKDIGQQGLKSFSGAKIISGKKS